ncbi:MAG: SMC-Scp complex subunit ScpB [Lachnospiraceae bacterium]|nr:SMC-Scp complex subunit ScpB [Lachnospiraceae bacterium]MDY4971691.1 SMC-Scp complex subunit ScpB [Lachnospiraceae bacterium]
MDLSKEAEMAAAAEAVLFAMGEPVSLQVMASALKTDVSTAGQVIDYLRGSYETQERGIHLIELEGSYQLCTKPEFYENLITVAAMPEKPVLTDTILETLSIVAYRQPVTKAEISRIRGVSSDHAVSRLVEYGLIREAGRLNAPGRPMLFVTTKEFLRRFGMDSLEQLPEMKVSGKDTGHAEVESAAEE